MKNFNKIKKFKEDTLESKKKIITTLKIIINQMEYFYSSYNYNLVQRIKSIEVIRKNYEKKVQYIGYKIIMNIVDIKPFLEKIKLPDLHIKEDYKEMNFSNISKIIDKIKPLISNQAKPKRIIYYITDYLRDPPCDSTTIDMIEYSNCFLWKTSIKGPIESPYKNGKFDIEIIFPENYPSKPPQCFLKPKYFILIIMNQGMLIWIY